MKCEKMVHMCHKINTYTARAGITSDLENIHPQHFGS